ncbi:I78 family peptidase inhibitor [Stenotrophomonas sp.]|uniref:I78 family peptidase inhibitor n=1 Tax=Stenotrophomonas sp. TaxID=69392 RepID=UPI002FC7C800
MTSLTRILTPAALVLPLLLGACVSTPGPQVKGAGLCKADGLDWAVGQPADEANMRKLSAQSGAGLVNPIGPGTITTRDLRQDRLRVFIDKDNVITAVRCE